MEGESDEQVGGELECDIISRVLCALCKAGGMRQEVDSRDEVTRGEMSDW